MLGITNFDIMKKKLLLLLILISGKYIGYAQITEELYAKKVEEITQLRKEKDLAEIANKKMIETNQNNYKSFLNKIDSLNFELSELKKFKTLKVDFDQKLISKSDSINFLKKELLIKDTIFTNLGIECENKKREERDLGKKEAFASIVITYKNQPFDDLIRSSNKEAIARDIRLVGDDPEIEQVLVDLQNYFSALKLLSEKYNPFQVENALANLSRIKSQSKLVDILINDIENYKIFSHDFKDTINKLIVLDEKTAGDDFEIKRLKLNDSVAILANYMYDFYDYSKYPYLSDIMNEIIKRKMGNADAEITDLLKRLE